MLRGQIEAIELAFMIANHPQSVSDKAAIRVAAEHCVAHYRTHKDFTELDMDYFTGLIHGISAVMMGLPHIKVPEYLASRDRRDQEPGDGDLEGLRLSPLKLLQDEGVLDRLQQMLVKEMEAARREAGGDEGISKLLIERLRAIGVSPEDTGALGAILQEALERLEAKPEEKPHELNDGDFLRSLGIGDPNLTEEPYEDDEEKAS